MKILFPPGASAYAPPGVIRRIQFWAALLAAALALGRCRAADASYAVDVWNTADGLPQSSVIAITQTHDGYLWLGTLNGLARFDGNAFTPFNVNNTPGLPSNRIVFLFEDSHSNLWVGTDNAGLCVIQNGVVKNFEETAAAGRITAALEESNAVWFSTINGNFFGWRDGRLEPHSAEVTDDFALKMFGYSRHILIPGKGGKAWQLQAGQVAKLDGHGAERSLGRSPWTHSPVPLPFRSGGRSVNIDASVTATAEDKDGNLAVGTADAGVYWITGAGDWRHSAAPPDDPFRNAVLALCFDQEENLWVGTDGGGLYRVKKSHHDSPAGLPDGVVKSAAEDAAGGLWVAYNGHGLAYLLSNTLSSYAIGLSSNAWSVLVDRQQHVWAGTRGEGLFRLESGEFRPLPPGWSRAQVFALLQDRAGEIWAGSDSGLASYDERSGRNLGVENSLPPCAVRALAEDAASNLWIGTEGGLFTRRDGKISLANAPIKDISSLLAGTGGILWAGSSGHGLAWLANGRWTRCTVTNGLASDDIGYLIEDEKNLWLGSYEGLMQVEKSSLAEFAADPARKISCHVFLTSECSPGAQPAAIRTRAGTLLFPTVAGLVSVNPADLKRNTNPPPVVIESIAVDGVLQKNNPLSSLWPERVTLRPQNEQLEIHFTALNFSAPKGAQFGVRFKYQLEGHDQKATDIGGERVAHFSRLTPGNYVFRVMACNEDGYWNNTGATITVIVEPPFWRQPWFLAAGMAGFLAALAGAIYLISTAKLRRQLHLARQKEMVEFERARIARDLHDQLGANLTQVTLLGEMAEADKDQPAEIEQHARQICATARETTRSLDEIVWAVNPANDTLESLANYACKYAQDYFAMAGVRYRSELPPGLPPTPILPEVRHNVFLAFKEADNNVVKHAQAGEAHVKLQLAPDRFILSVSDNGRGLGDVSGKQLRNGLKNMRRRLADVHGRFEIAPGPAGGTVVTLTVPLVAME